MGSNGELRFRQRKGNPAEMERELKTRRVAPQVDALTRNGEHGRMPDSLGLSVNLPRKWRHSLGVDQSHLQVSP